MGAPTVSSLHVPRTYSDILHPYPLRRILDQHPLDEVCLVMAPVGGY